MQILQVTDPHLYGSASGRLRGVETDPSLHAVLDDAFARVPDYSAVLVTGDLVQDDTVRLSALSQHLRQPEEAGAVHSRQPRRAARPCAGNLNGAPFQICGTHEIDGWQFIMLDSYDPGHVGGRLTQNELARLDGALKGSSKHAMVCLHHHPIAMGSRWLDTVGLAEPEAFWRIIDAHAHVRAVVWGHVHQVYDGRRGDVRLFATPSTGAQFLPEERSLRGRFASAGLSELRPACRWAHRHRGALGGIAADAAGSDSLSARLSRYGDSLAVADCCSASPRARTAHCMRCGSCTASTTPCICSAPFTCCARATIRCRPPCWRPTATPSRCSWK